MLVPLENGPLDVAAGVNAGPVPSGVLVLRADPEPEQPSSTQSGVRVKLSPSMTVTNEELTSKIEHVLSAQFAEMISMSFSIRLMSVGFAVTALLLSENNVVVGRS